MISTCNQAIINRFASLTDWVDELAGVPDQDWSAPIAEGKASIAGIVAHLTQWDRYLIRTAVPDALQRQGVVFPEFDSFNDQAYAYARSGVTKPQLIEQFHSTRLELCKLLESIGDESLERPITANGTALCPHTGTPYSLIYITEEFIEHDVHHQSQIKGAAQSQSNG
ncbi:DinB family protein [Paenibacillus sp. 1011MAR3C5]|uniref:DinB family protein n=1 Tax=Paenibacillus sp. 1011MAR3C5 TaxID=1675787 RepID=UPI000E6C7228|nr:DinB family protein [Paenibacillus sp. 1011MAR3C5]RJE88458.1 DinB family protein [Paenibacillus sp. 1011MAR3C5]